MKKLCLLMLITITCFTLAGCRSPYRPVTYYGSGLSETGLPSPTTLVAGGYSISYRAPEDGTGYLVESNTQRLLQTASLKKTEVFRFDSSTDNMLKVADLDPVESKFSLYFVPNAKPECK